MANDLVLYLNRNDGSPFYSKLRRALLETKQAKAGAGQWAAMIRAFTQKGVKALEIEETTITSWLDAQPRDAILDRKALLAKLDSLTFTIKEVTLGSPRFSEHRQPGGAYKELLYIANSERDNVNDELEQIEYEMGELAFDMARAVDEPQVLLGLEQRRTFLLDMKDKAIDFPEHHFSDVVNGRHGRNLIAHCRVTLREDQGIYFIDEVQSDWAQRGRREEWRTIPRGPLVTNTEAWSGMVLRRQLQLAAQNPKVLRVGWITESMRNGGQQQLDRERAQEEQARARQETIKAEEARILETMGAETMEGEPLALLKKMARGQGESAADRAGLRAGEGMNGFYLKVLPKIAERVVAGTGARVAMTAMDLGNGRGPVEVPTLEITPAVRQKLLNEQPMYSRAPLLHLPRDIGDQALCDTIKRCGEMLGSVKHVRLVAHLYDIATGKRVAGRYANNLVQIALDAQDVDEVADHESFHFAEDRLLDQREKAMLLEQFAPGTELHYRVQDVLVRRGDFKLARHCQDPREAAAQGFALWRKGELDAAPSPIKGIFSDILASIRDVLSWLRSEVLEHRLQTPEAVFQAFADGHLARRHEEARERYERAALRASTH